MNFDEAFEIVIGHEGGYVNNPKDPGGETNWGISKRSYPGVDIKNLTKDGAKEIYLRDYWKRLQSDSLPESIRFDLFDTAANSGPGTAARLLQRAVGTAEDGHIGPLTIAAVNALHPWEIRAKFNAARLNFMTYLSIWPEFGKGWSRRIASNLSRG
jgi:lysozyme family protein